MQLRTRGCIFDLDGTLADTIEDLTDAMNYGLDQLGCPLRTIDECRQMVGSGLGNFVSQALPEDRQNLCEELLGVMVAYYRENCLKKTKAYAGIEELLKVLLDRGVLLAVLTNKNQVPAEIIVERLFGKSMFSPVIGAGEGRKVKPDPATTLEIAAQWSLDRSEVMYVGDSDVDILTARAAGVNCVACLWGYRSREQLLSAGADLFAEHPLELVNFL